MAKKNEHRVKKEVLEEKENYYRSLIYNLHEDILVIDRNYTITDVNNSILLTSGKKRNEVVGKKCHHLSHGLAVPCAQKGETCHLDTVFRDGVSMSCIHQHKRDDGSPIFVDILFSPIKNKQGEVTHVVEALRDITDLIQTREELRSSKDELQSLFDYMSNGFANHLIVTDENGRPVDYIFLDVNKAFETITGLRREDLIGKRVTEALPGIENSEFDWIGTYGKVAQTRQPRRFEQYFELLDRWCSVAAYSPSEGHVAVIFEDITERKIAAQKLETSLKEKELLLKEIHHRVKNNMAVISSMLSIQSADTGDSFVKEVFTDARQRIRAMSLVHEKLYQSEDLSRIDFSEYLHSLAGKFSGQFNNSTIALKVLADKISLGIDDAIPCGLIINELMVNTFKYAFPGGKNGTLTIRMQLLKNGNYKLVISDNGIGLPGEIDWQNPPTFGLNLVQMLVQQLQGQIKVSGTGGTKFTITFPAED